MRFDALCLALGTNAIIGRADQFADGLIREAESFHISQHPGLEGKGCARELTVGLDDGFYGLQKPAVDARQLVNFIDADAVTNCLRHGKNPQRGGVAQFIAQIIEMECAGIEATHADVEHPHRFLDDLRKRTANRHHLADTLHFSADAGGRAVEFAEIPARKLANYIVHRRFKESRGAARDAIRNLGERVAQRQLGGDVSERVAGRLARQRTRPRKPGVNLDDAIIHAIGVKRELDVALADDAEVANGANRDRTQQLNLGVV